MGRYKTSFAYDDHADEALDAALSEALARLDVLNNGAASRLRESEELARLNQLSKRKSAALRLATMEDIAGMREEKRRRGMIPG